MFVLPGELLLKLFMRVYGNCENREQARDISAGIRQALAKFQLSDRMEPKPYWKIPELFGFTFDLTPATEASFLDIVNLCDAGWLHLGDGQDRSSIWNRTEGAVFLTPAVSWAELSLSL